MSHVYFPHGKRLFDLTLLLLATPAFILLSPLLLLLVVAMRLESPGPIFFSQMRAGYKGDSFRIYKFRTLVVNDISPLEMPDGNDHFMATRTGRILRRFKLDELPQLWNVAKGDMSLVGPRPALVERAAEYTAEQRRRFEVLPGIAGWTQINGNCELGWDDRIRLDVWYVDHVSFLLDLKILLLTAGVIFKGEIVNPEALAEASKHVASLAREASHPAPADMAGSFTKSAASD